MFLSKRQHFLCCFSLSENLLLKEKKGICKSFIFFLQIFNNNNADNSYVNNIQLPFSLFHFFWVLEVSLGNCYRYSYVSVLKAPGSKLHGYKHINRNTVMPTFILLVWCSYMAVGKAEGLLCSDKALDVLSCEHLVPTSISVHVLKLRVLVYWPTELPSLSWPLSLYVIPRMSRFYPFF